jgi:hypothetical protein
MDNIVKWTLVDVIDAASCVRHLPENTEPRKFAEMYGPVKGKEEIVVEPNRIWQIGRYTVIKG